MKRFWAFSMAAALLILGGCQDLAEEALDEAGEVVRDQKHKVVEQLQDTAISTLDEQRESAASALTGDEEEGAEDSDSSL